MSGCGSPRWWSVRPAQNLKPATYRCPLCNRRLPALRPHMLLAPEGSGTGRRHAHTECVLAARAAGDLPTLEEWRRAARAANRGGRPVLPWWQRVGRRLRRRFRD